MTIRIHAESTSGATEIDKIRLKDTIQHIARKLNYGSYGIISDIVWIIYNPLHSEERDKKKETQPSVQSIIAELEENRMKTLRQFGVIDFRKQYRPEYGYCYIPAKRIYISINALRQKSAVFNGGSRNTIQEIVEKLKYLPGMERNMQRMMQKRNKSDIPDSLQELVLHELMHIVTEKGDDDKGFWAAFEDAKSRM